MRQHAFQVAIAVVSVLSVAAVFISPAVDLEATMMHASRIAKLPTLAMVMASTALAGSCGRIALDHATAHFAPRFSAGANLEEEFSSGIRLGLFTSLLADSREFRKQKDAFRAKGN